MIRTVYPTQAKKLGVIAATYRSGTQSLYGTCPSTCPLIPIHHRTQHKLILDTDYLHIERQAVPRQGIAWSYTHFPPASLLLNTNPTESTINISTDSTRSAIAAFTQGYDTTYVAPHTDIQWPRRINDVQFVRCPAETNTLITCQSCGNGRPLCARQNRPYVLVFVAHGKSKQSVTNKTGGCYASNFPCKQQWRRTQQGVGPTTWNETSDPERLLAWTSSLPSRTLLRHRVAGDLNVPFLST